MRPFWRDGTRNRTRVSVGSTIWWRVPHNRTEPCPNPKTNPCRQITSLLPTLRRLAAIPGQGENDKWSVARARATPTTPAMEAVASLPLPLVFSSYRINSSQTHRRLFPTRSSIHDPHVKFASFSPSAINSFSSAIGFVKEMNLRIFL